jgi:hypothetical protein
MEKGKGLARRWAVELHDASSSSSRNYSFSRSDREIHVLFFSTARRTMPPPLASGRRPRPPGRGRFVRFPDAIAS